MADPHTKKLRVPTRYFEIAAVGATVAADTDLHEDTRGLHIGTAGNITVEIGGSTLTVAVAGGMPFLGEFDRVLASGYTVTGVWALV
ncbi:hypothetical protein [Loktanella sp. SALINAS62]|uniref:spike base protein, RCAP_Rcc01079 family n=1 Tax=Loktanella sp. SALINAS62 TaxID=2706124 RepID=UPI001B8CAD42|nr:hypothetical protein [Loktanella sp. SALINAS62]MBS1301703.1 hypothetical protein [Loktanella sp. SALINAS62]